MLGLGLFRRKFLYFPNHKPKYLSLIYENEARSSCPSAKSFVNGVSTDMDLFCNLIWESSWRSLFMLALILWWLWSHDSPNSWRCSISIDEDIDKFFLLLSFLSFIAPSLSSFPISKKSKIRTQYRRFCFVRYLYCQPFVSLSVLGIEFLFHLMVPPFDIWKQQSHWGIWTSALCVIFALPLHE